MKDTRAKIMEAAFALMIKNGVDAVSTGDIAKSLGISRSLPYRYFPTKRELVYCTFKSYFCDRYMPESEDGFPKTLGGAVEMLSVRTREMLAELGRVIGGKIDVFDYNALYLEALKREPRFKKYSAAQSVYFSEIVDNAIAGGEIKPMSPDFVKRIFMDIWGRGSDIFSQKSGRRTLEDIVSDLESFYELIRAR